MVTSPSDPTAPPAPVTLRQLLRATPRLDAPRAAHLLAGLAAAADGWHARGGAHGAVTPERVLVGAEDRVTLAPPPRDDGGAASPTYLAPERIDGADPDPRGDVYALGLIGWEMLAGRPPWEGESLYGVVVKQREQDLPRLTTLRPGLPRALVAAIEGCLHKAPGDRWHSAGELLSVLAPAVPVAAPADLHAAAPVPAPAPAPPAGVMARAAAAAAAAGAVPGAAESPAYRPPPQPVRPPARGAGAAGRGRRLLLATAGVAVAGAAAAAVVVARGRDTARATQTWLDSLTTPAAAAAAGAVGAAPAVVTPENTTAAPIRRTGGSVRVSAGPPPEDSAPVAVVDSGGVAAPPPIDVSPTLEPTPPLVAPRPGRPVRPTVPRPDTGASPVAPDSL